MHFIQKNSVLFIRRFPFASLLITSANAMTTDMLDCSNHCYIQDFPLKSSSPSSHHPKASRTLKDLKMHLEELLCPADILFSLDNYDFSYMPFSLVLSRPGTYSGPEFSSFGLIRLGKLSRRVLAKDKSADPLLLEVCSASLGQLWEFWLRQVW